MTSEMKIYNLDAKKCESRIKFKVRLKKMTTFFGPESPYPHNLTSPGKNRYVGHIDISDTINN